MKHKMLCWWAWTDDNKLVALGKCEDFDDADEKAPMNTHWIFNEPDLQQLADEIYREIG